ncbi:MAG: PAS domain S-box protein [Lentimicrobiaceae bacterium]|nr:PAS domain S-box protein [Lentimicrobiaceae bacterium]
MENQFYRDIIFNAPLAYACHKISYNNKGLAIDAFIEEANNSFASLCNSEISAFINKRLTDLLPELKNAYQNWPELMAGTISSPETGEITFKHTSTSQLYKIQFHIPEPGYCVTLFIPLSETSYPKATLPDNQERYSLLFETMEQGVIFQDNNGIINYANSAAEKILGLTTDQLYGRTSRDPKWKAIDENGHDLKGENHPISIALKSGTSVLGYTMGVFNPKTEETHWIKVDAIPDFKEGSSKPFQAHAIFTDISESRAKEIKLKESEEKYRFLTENIMDVIWVLDLETKRFTFVSQSVEKLRGYTSEEVLTQLASEVLSPASLAYYNGIIPERLSNFLKTGLAEVYYDELEQPCKNGTTIRTEAITYFRKNPETQKIEIIGTSRDISERKKAEDALKESNRKLSTLINNLKGLVYRCRNDRHWTMELLSNSIYQLAGYMPDEIIGNKKLSYNSLIHPDDRNYVRDIIKPALEQKHHFQLEYRIIHKDGTTKWVGENGCGIYENGKLIALEGYITDISESKLAQEALRHSEEKFKMAFYLSPEIITITRLSDGLYVDANEAFCKTLNYLPSEVIGKSALNLGIWANPEDRQKLTDSLKEHGHVWSLDATFRSKNGTLIEGLMSASLIEINGTPHLLAVTRDITERKKAQGQIKSLLERIDLATKSAGLGIWDWDITNNSLQWDEQMYMLYGINENDFPNAYEAWLKCVHPDDVVQVNRTSENAQKSLNAYESDFRVLLPDGSIRYIKALGNVFRDEQGVAVRMLGVNYDITAQKISAQALFESEERNRTIISASTEGIILQRNDGRILTWNKAAERIFGIKEADALGETSTSRPYYLYNEQGDEIKGEDHPSMITLKTGTPQKDILMRVVRPDSQDYWIKVNTEPIFTDKSGLPTAAVVTFSDITALKKTQDKLKITEDQVRRKLESILTPDHDIGNLELPDVMDIESVQSLMNNFYQLTQIGVGIIDLKGKVLVGTGWQNICVAFHRKNELSCQYCFESDTEITRGIEPGEFKLYKCRNNMWDIATPIYIAGKHLGNLFLGQFLFDDEEPDLSTFKKQARQFGFDEEKYLEALKQVPRWNKKTVEAAMDFYIQLANMISSLSYSNVRLAQTLEENKRAQEALQASAEVTKSIPSGLFIYRFEAPDKLFLIEANPAALKITGLKKESILGLEFNQIWPEAEKIGLTARYLEVMRTSEPYLSNNIFYADDNLRGAFRISAFKIPDNKLGVAFEDETELRNSENKLIEAKEKAEESEALLRAIIDNAPFEIWARNTQGIGILENKFTFEHFGVSILGRTPDYEEIPPEEAALWKSNNKKVLQGEILNEECQYTVKGINRTYQQIIAPIITSTGIDGIVGFNIDITENKKNQLAIDNERKMLRTLVETIPDLFFLKDPQGKYITCNNMFEKLTGLSAKMMAGKTDHDVFPHEVADAFRYHDLQALNSEKPLTNLETVTNINSGQQELLETIKTRVFDSNGTIIGVLGISRNVTAIYQAQEALRNREEIYSSIVNQASDSIALIDFETSRFIEFNPAAHLNLGYSADEFSQMGIKDIEASQNPDEIIKHFSVIRDSGGITFESQHKHKSGTILDIRSRAKVITIKGKEYISAIWSDITAQKKIQAAMREKDLIFQSLMEKSPIYIFFKDHHLKSVFLSKNFEQLLAKPLEELIGRTMNELFPSNMALSMIEEDKLIFENGELVTIDEELNGRYYTTIKFPIYRDNAPPLLAGFTIDITDRKLAENALMYREKILRQAQQMAHIGNFEFDFRKNTSIWSENMYRIFDVEHTTELNNVIQNILPDLILPEDYSRTKQIFNDAIKGLCNYELVYRIRKKDNSIRDIHSRADIERDENGNPIRMIGLIQDITEQKRTEKEIQRLNESLEKRVEERTHELQIANHELEAFAYTVSHDLRAPLRAINGFTNILKEDYETLFDADGHKLINIITENTSRMGVLIDDLLAFSRLGRAEMNFCKVDMNQLVKQAYHEITTPELKEQIKFIAHDLPEIMGDNSLLKQVWLNLLSNAVKFSSKVKEPEIIISAQKEAGYVTFKISDNGVGFNMKYVGKLFGVFQRLHSAGEYEGTGAGLAIVQRIVVRHKGKVWARAEQGKGADFFFSLPEMPD